MLTSASWCSSAASSCCRSPPTRSSGRCSARRAGSGWRWRRGWARLLTFDHDPASREPTVEVAHEALLREWPRLGEWLAASRERLLVQRRMMFSAAEWQHSGRESSFLATGARLAQFAELAQNADGGAALALTAGEQADIAASPDQEARGQAAAPDQQGPQPSLPQRAAR